MELGGGHTLGNQVRIHYRGELVVGAVQLEGGCRDLRKFLVCVFSRTRPQMPARAERGDAGVARVAYGPGWSACHPGVYMGSATASHAAAGSATGQAAAHHLHASLHGVGSARGGTAEDEAPNPVGMVDREPLRHAATIDVP